MMMKQTLRALIVGFVGMQCGYGQQPARMEVPAVTARTNLASKSIAITKSGYTRTEQDGRQMSVSVEVRFFQAPPAPYKLQCFFISKNEYTQKMQVFDGLRKTAQGQVFNWEFMSMAIAGSTRKFTSVPFSSTWIGIGSDGSVTGVGGTYGTHDKYEEKTGYKIAGWVMRVVGQGKVLRVESNQPALLQIAQTDNMAKQFNAIAARLPDEDRGGPMRFDPNTGAVIPPGSNPGKVTTGGSIFSTPAPSVTRPPAAPATAAGPQPPSPAPAQNGEPINAVIQLAGNSAPVDATVLVTEALPQEEEKLIAEGPFAGGKFACSVNPAVRCNLYVIADGYALFLQKGIYVSPANSISLTPAAGTHVRLVAKKATLSALGDDIADLIAVRANQGSPPFQWIIQADSPNSRVQGGTVSERGDLWLKYGESVRITRGAQTVACTLLGSIARKYCIFECEPAPR